EPQDGRLGRRDAEAPRGPARRAAGGSPLRGHPRRDLGPRVAPARRAGHRHRRRPAGGALRPGVPRARRGQEYLWHRVLHAAQHGDHAGGLVAGTPHDDRVADRRSHDVCSRGQRVHRRRGDPVAARRSRALHARGGERGDGPIAGRPEPVLDDRADVHARDGPRDARRALRWLAPRGGARAGLGGRATPMRRGPMRRLRLLALPLMLVLGAAVGAAAQAPIESELALITPVSKFIHDAALKAFADYAKEKWNVTVKVSAIPAGTPVAYGRIVEWKGRPEVDIFWGGESALFEKLAEQKLLQKVEISREAWDSIPASIGTPKPIPLKDKDGHWVGTALEPYGLVYHPKKIQRLGIPEPKEWDDLLNPKLKGEVAQCAPTRSSSSNATYEVMLSMHGEDKGWDWLRKLAGNTGLFTARSRDVPTVVAKGEFTAGFAVPSYMAFEEKLAGFDLKFVAPRNA